MAPASGTNSGMPREKTDIAALKSGVARLSVGSNLFLVITKLAVGFALGSVSIISEAIHSGIDLIAAVIAYFSVKKSSQPADEEHSFGHGKFEDMSGLIEAILIFIAAALIIWEAAKKLLGEESALSSEYLLAGIGVMALSALLNWIVSGRLMKVAKQTESIALESDAWHLRTDVFTSLGVFGGLVLIRITGITILDPLIAIGVACIIIKAAYDLTRRSLADLMDRSLPREEEERIRRIICEHKTSYADFHDLRTRRAGPERFIDFHILVSKNASIQEAHDFADHLEADLKLEFPRANITIHMEPCEETCSACTTFCTRKESGEVTDKKQ